MLIKFVLLYLLTVGECQGEKSLLTCRLKLIKAHGFVKTPASSFRCNLRHCGVLYVRLIPQVLRASNLKLLLRRLLYEILGKSNNNLQVLENGSLRSTSAGGAFFLR